MGGQHCTAAVGELGHSYHGFRCLLGSDVGHEETSQNHSRYPVKYFDNRASNVGEMLGVSDG